MYVETITLVALVLVIVTLCSNKDVCIGTRRSDKDHCN